MTKLQSVISRFEELPIEQQDKLADFLCEFTISPDDKYIFSDEQRAEIKRLLNTDNGSHSFDEVFEQFLT
jgi:hypothetical protein